MLFKVNKNSKYNNKKGKLKGRSCQKLEVNSQRKSNEIKFFWFYLPKDTFTTEATTSYVNSMILNVYDIYYKTQEHAK